MDSTTAWPLGLTGQMPSFPSQQFEPPQHNEDWEDWLRWDPAADATSPDDNTFHSGSSKNDSPLQDPALPVPSGLYGKGIDNDALVPLIAGEDSLDFGGPLLPENESFLFGMPTDTTANFDFNAVTSLQPNQPAIPTTIDTRVSAWPLPSNAIQANVSPSDLSSQHFLPAGPISGAPAPSSSMHYSPSSATNNASSVSSNSPQPPKKRGGRKRKAEVEQEQEQQRRDENGDSQDGDEPPVKKTSHNVIEKRYRNNLNDKIVELRNSVPSLRAMGRPNGAEDSEDLGGLTPAHKLNKATVMGKATEYIKHLEKRNQTMADEMEQLKARLAAVEAAIGKSRDRQSSLSSSPPSGTLRPRQASSSSQNGAPGFLGVPQEQLRYSQAPVAQQYMQQQAQPTYVRPPNPPVEAQNQPQYTYGRRGGTINKLMMGAMAGVMVMEGFSEQDDSRQMFAVPTLFKRGLDTPMPSSPAALARQAGLPLLRVMCVIAALIYLIFPLFTFSPRRKQKTRQAVRLPQVPSLASPVEVRRKAWLTAVQTVYVPKHFLLEVVEVGSKMAKLSFRRLVGPEAFNAMFGINKEEEAARVKAWDIALDAQLAGGDAEVSYYRLLLTLMASGTLPDSPIRLMQKAVHFRIFFWEVANAGYGNMVGFKQFTEKVGKIYWDSARKHHKQLLHAKGQGRPIEDEDDVELLPDHLANLVELDCDDVLSDEMIQRAWNLAWNKSSAHSLPPNPARDSVVEDHAIRSPLDAVAAWYANMTIDDTLADTLTYPQQHPYVETNAHLAVSVAPPASSTHTRALAALAVLAPSRRESHIVTALEALPVDSVSPTSSSETTINMNVVAHAPESPEVRTALTLAKLLALSHSSTISLPARQRLHAALASSQHLTDFTLLTAVAIFDLLRAISAPQLLDLLPHEAKCGVEGLVGSLRVWAGTSVSSKAGLGRVERGIMVDMCVKVAREVGGWGEGGCGGEVDSGYGSGGCEK